MNFEKIKRSVQRFTKYRLQKIHLDWIISILSIPVLLTAVIINWGNLTHKASNTTSSITPSPQVIIVPQNSSAPATSCIKSIGPIDISYPTENQTVSDNPVCITIDYSNSSYCSVVWSYRINGGAWSNFSNNSPCLYNLPNGTVTFNLRVDSTVSSSTTTISRDFTYNGSTPTFTPTPTTVATSSAQ